MPKNNIEKPTEIEFKFKISKDDIRKAIYYANKNEKLTVIPKFEIFNDDYFKNKISDSFLRQRSVITFKKDVNYKGTRKNFYPKPELDPYDNYLNFLEYGLGSFTLDPNTHGFNWKYIETFYTLKRKSVVNGVETNDETEIKANDNGIEFMNKMISYNGYDRFYQKTKREAFHIVPVGYGEKCFPGCRIEIVSVAETNLTITHDYYAEVEFSDSRVLFKDKQYKNMSIEKVLNLFANLVFEIPMEKLDSIKIPYSWEEIINEQKINNKNNNIINIKMGDING